MSEEKILALKHKYSRVRRDPSQLQMFVDEILDIIGGLQPAISTLSYQETMTILEEAEE